MTSTFRIALLASCALGSALMANSQAQTSEVGDAEPDVQERERPMDPGKKRRGPDLFGNRERFGEDGQRFGALTDLVEPVRLGHEQSHGRDLVPDGPGGVEPFVEGGSRIGNSTNFRSISNVLNLVIDKK